MKGAVEPFESRVRAYLKERYGPSARLLAVEEIGKRGRGEIKKFGYGKPLLLKFEAQGREFEAVLNTVKPSRFGHEFFYDRASILLFQHRAFNSLPGHARALDVGFATRDGWLRTAGGAEEFFLLVERAAGAPYADDLFRIAERGAGALDYERAVALAERLARIHRRKGPARDRQLLYERRVRDLVGHGECIFGMADGYPRRWWGRLEAMERDAVGWRWRLKEYARRLARVHGDYHPWNILFTEGSRFTLLDRSRGEWGEPADDVASLAVNYLLFSVLRHGRLEGDWQRLFDAFLGTYFRKTRDRGLLDVLPPWLAFRGLVVASPVWYPGHPPAVREALLRFTENMLASDRFDPARVNRYFA
ncbi:MAG: phosphotransferase [Halobacteria archaeon]